jgi:hypothetical protein
MNTKKMTVLIALFSFLLMSFSAGMVWAETMAAASSAVNMETPAAVEAVESSGTMDLVKMLSSQLSVTEPQASGGAGALFSMAKGALSETDYGKVASAMPEVSNLIKSAPAVSESTSDASDKVAGLAGGLGSITKAVDGANKYAAVYDQFKQLGLDKGKVAQYVPVVLSFANSEGGESVMNLLKSVWQ